jgi:2-keto-4-pentenoate hydratase
MTMTKLVDALVNAHRSAQQVALADVPEPADIAGAYAVQAAVAAALDAHVAGWKVGMRPDGTAMAGPLYAANLRDTPAHWPLPAAGTPLIVEVEVAFRLNRDLPARPGFAYTRHDIAEAVGEIVVGIELVRGRYAITGATPFLALLADNVANTAYIVGGARTGLGAVDVTTLRCRYARDGAPVFDRVGGHPQGDPFAPILACANAGNLPLGGLRAGQLVTTGTLTPPFEVTAATTVIASLDGIGSVSVTID